MLLNYIKIAFRNLWRSKGFSLINILGLAIGMASAILILLWIVNEMSYDSFNVNKDRLYQVWNRGTFDGKLQCWNVTPMPMGPALKQEIPEVEANARVNIRWYVTAAGERKFSTKSYAVDPAFLTMFTLPMVKGNPATALDQPQSIVLTEKMAKKMFGDEDPINRLIRIDTESLTVTGILKDLPTNSSFDFEFLLPWQFLQRTHQEDLTWGNNTAFNYVLLKPGATEAAVNEKIRNITKRHSNGQEMEEVFIHPLRKWHLYSNFENGRNVGGQITIVRLFAIIAAFILLIACINFMNLSTARSERRSKEVGIRKVAGAGRRSLIMQFLGESVLIACMAAMLAIPLVQWSLPAFNRLIANNLSLPYGNPYFWLIAIIFIVFTGLVAGSYPAFILSSFKPVIVLKGMFKKTHARVNPRKVLVVVQFSFAIILIISTFVVVQQIRYAQQRVSGYERSQLVYHWITGDINKFYPAIKQALLTSNVATAVSRSSFTLTGRSNDSWGFSWEGKDPKDLIDFDVLSTDGHIVGTAGLQLVQGRDIDVERFPTDSTAMLLNETAARAIGFTDPIGKTINGDNNIRYHVVGVIKDFVLGSPYDHIHPLLIEGPKDMVFNVVNIRFAPTKDMAKSLQVMERLFKQYNPDYPFEYHFADEDYALKFNGTRRIATMTALFSTLTIIISCLGLFGLAAYMTSARVKEIGVRKVLGASVFRITTLLTKEFLLLVVLSIVIATPVAWYVMHHWLEAFEYRIAIEWWVFVLAGTLAMVISLLTVSYKAIRAALSNPVKSLRSE